MSGVTHLEFLVEGQSTKDLVDQIVPRIVDLPFASHDMGSKSQFMKKVPNRLQGYSYEMQSDPGLAVVLLRDRDQEDCRIILAELRTAIAGCGLSVASVAAASTGNVLCRLADEMTEAWFFGDGTALHRAYPRLPGNLCEKSRYRRPDQIRDPARQLARELKERNYYGGGLDKPRLARDVAAHMDVEHNTSPSFVCFREGLRFLAGTINPQEN